MQEMLQHIPEWLQAIAIFLLSTLKSYTGSTLSAVFEQSYFEMILLNLGGAFVSILISYRFRHQILNLLKKRNKAPNGYNPKLKNILTKWNKYGFISAMIVSPVLISIPIGVIISAHFKTPKTKLFICMSISAFFWINVFYFTTRFGISIFA